MTPMEGRGLARGGMLLLILAVLRLGLDHAGHREAFLPQDSSTLTALLEESQADRDDRTLRSTPLGPGETLDPNRSGEAELDRLPGVGPATARAIVANRQEAGGFSTAEDLLRVPGIGPAKLGKIAAYLDFTRGMPVELRRRPGTEGNSGAGRAGEGDGTGSHRPPGAAIPVDLNRASIQELESLPGIGPALARRVAESREKEGPFASPQDLLRVKGIGPAKLARLIPFLRR